MTTYTTHGSVRGGCGHQHRTMAAAVRCLQSDQEGCRQQRGYSDRSVRVIEGDYQMVARVADDSDDDNESKD